MKNARPVGALMAIGFLMVGCYPPSPTAPSAPGTGAGSTAGSTPPSKGAVIDYARKFCGFVADAGPVIKIISSPAPGLTTAEEIATAICQAWVRQAAPLPGVAPTPPTVAGVVVTGHCAPSGCRAM